MTTIPIFYAIDDRYAPYLAVSIQSLIQTSHAQHHYQLNILTEQLSAKNQQQLAQLATANVEIRFIPMGASLAEKLQHDHSKLRGDYQTLTIYFRLFIADLFPQYERAIYLDADTIITTDIAELSQLSLGSQLVAGVTDTFAIENQPTADYVVHALGLRLPTYINSGVLVLNLAVMRAERFSQQFLGLLNTTDFKLIAPDQDYLNVLAQGRIKYFAATWNAMPTTGTPVAAPRIIHYSVFGKPWHYQQVQNGAAFWRVAQGSNYYLQLQAELSHYSAADKRADQQSKLALFEVARQGAIQARTLTELQRQLDEA